MADPAVVALRKKKLWNSPKDMEPRLTRSSDCKRKREEEEEEEAEEEDAVSASENGTLVWSDALSNVLESEEMSWMVGTTKSLDEAFEIIEAHSRSLLCDYVKSHPSSVSKKQRNSEQSRLLWHAKHIPFDGTPFTVKAYHQFRCAFSMKYKSKRKDGEDSVASKTPFKGITCTDCPAKIIVKEIKKYPRFSIPLSASKQKKMNALKMLKVAIQNKSELGEEDRIIVSFPLTHVHNHPFCGKNRSINQSILKKIKSLIDEGNDSPKKIKSLLAKFVEDEFGRKPNPPSLDDQAFYPPLKSINNILYTHTKKNSHNHNGPSAKVKRKECSKKPATKAEIPPVGPVSPEPTTLEEAVEAFCSESFSDIIDYPPELRSSGAGGDLAKKIRDKLDELHTLTFSVTDSHKLQILLDNLQLLAEQFCSKQNDDVMYSFEEEEEQQQQPVAAVSPETETESCPLSVMMTSYPLSTQSNTESCLSQFESSQNFIVPKLDQEEMFIEQTTLNHDQL